MALGIDLYGVSADGADLWHFTPRMWPGSAIKDQFGPRLEPADPWRSWEGFLTLEEVTSLQERYGKGQLVELQGIEMDFDELLKPPTARVRFRIEEIPYRGMGLRLSTIIARMYGV